MVDNQGICHRGGGLVIVFPVAQHSGGENIHDVML